MKYVIAATLSLASALAFAGQNDTSSSTAEQPDIAKVISVKPLQDPAKTNGLVNMEMTYVDSHGKTQTFDYTIMGYGRQNG